MKRKTEPDLIFSHNMRILRDCRGLVYENSKLSSMKLLLQVRRRHVFIGFIDIVSLYLCI